MSRYLSSRFASLEEYVPGEQPQDLHYIKLNTNESPYPPAPGVVKAVTQNEIDRLRLYSDPDCRALREALAAQYGVSSANIICGNGSDEMLSFLFIAFCDAQTGVSYPDISYGFYSVFADINRIAAQEVPLRGDLSICADDYCGLDRTIVIANPNAPTGLCLSAADIERIVQSNPNNVVVIDEAYVDFGGESVVPLTKKYDNLLVVQTFSKSRSLAGGRLGYAIGSEGLIADLNKIRNSTNPYNVDSLTKAVGLACLEEQDYYDNNCKKIVATREYTAQELQKLGFEMPESKTNFLFARHPKLAGKQLYLDLKARGILVRHLDKPRILDYNRITIGTPEQMETLLKTLREMI